MSGIKLFRRLSIRQMHAFNAMINAVFILAICLFVGFYASSLEKMSLLQESRLSHLNVLTYYENKNANLWQTYMPVVTDSELENAFVDFSQECAEKLSFSTRLTLNRAFEKMLLTDNDIVGVVLHSNAVKGQDYLYDGFSNSFTQLSSSSPFYHYFENPSVNRTVTGCREISFPNNRKLSVYGISGLFPDTNAQIGSLLVLYQANSLLSVYRSQKDAAGSEVLLLSADGEVIFDSTGRHYDERMDLSHISNNEDGIVTLDNEDYYVQITAGARSRYYSVILTPQNQIVRLAHKNTPAFILLAAALILLDFFFFLLTAHSTTQRVRELTAGIDRIGRQELDFRFPIKGTRDEFDQIAQRINDMAEAMQNNIEQVYLYSIREKSAEMGELQAKFNPHFLYNTLEIIRSHLQQKGDDDTANMIVLMARVFRSTLNSSHFTTLRNECLYINSYLNIYRWRYQNNFDVIFDMDTNLLECGIIRNLLQPLIENYFVHGFSPTAARNQIIIIGEPEGDQYILLTVEDNGLGMSPEKLKELNDHLTTRSNQVSSGSSYGLVNLNDRIRLFYGGDCGLTVSSVPNRFTRIRMKIRRMSLDEHESYIKRD